MAFSIAAGSHPPMSSRASCSGRGVCVRPPRGLYGGPEELLVDFQLCGDYLRLASSTVTVRAQALADELAHRRAGAGRRAGYCADHYGQRCYQAYR